ncbi:MAG: phosphatase PAP2 family protein [Candidatus Dormibacteria bacterium]
MSRLRIGDRHLFPAAAALLTFLCMAALVVIRQPRRVDIQVAQFMHDHGNLPLDLVLGWITVLGNAEVSLGLGFLVAAWLWFRGRRPMSLAFLVLPASVAVELILKQWLQHPGPGPELQRSIAFIPPVLQGVDIHTNGSFPSGHALRSVLLFGLVAWLARVGLQGAWRSWVSGVAVGLAVLVPVSRVYLGVHWLSDVLGGVALGIGLLALVIGYAEGALRGRESRPA